MNKTPFAKAIVLFFVILTISFMGFSKEKDVKSTWAVSPVSVDGSNDDWADITWETRKKVNADYAFKNDDENLFVLFVFNDPQYLSSISATGMTLWFNLEGKKKKNFGIKFIQRKVSPDALISRIEKEQGPLPEDEKKRIRSNPSYLVNDVETVGKKKKSPQIAEKGEIEPSLFRFMRQQKSLVFEYKIPLKMIAEQAPEMEIEPGRRIKIGFEWGGMTKEMKAALRQRTSELERTRTVDRDPASNRAGSGGGRTPMGLLSGPPKYDFWVDVQLAKNQ